VVKSLKIVSSPAFPSGEFDIIYADPCWPHYGSKDKDQAAGKHYDLMSMEELGALPVRALAAKRSVLFMWTTGNHLLNAAELMKAWGFTYRNIGFTWVKTRNKDGRVIGGQGARPSIVKQMTELVLVGSTVPRGRPLPLRNEGVHQVLEEPEEIEETVYSPRPGNIHSRKPAEVRARIESLFMPDVRRIELFSRERTPGWTVWGNQLPDM